MSTPPITRGDLAGALAGHEGARALRDAFTAAVSEPPRLLSLFGRYVQFNSAFGPGVANLAGEIAARQELFQDEDEPVRILRDRAAEVAAEFFHAAVDEFDDRATPWRDTHRTLAQAALKAMGAYCGYSPAQLDDVIRINAATEAARRDVWEGYGVGARLDDERLFSAMGFHAGSEVLADEEFTIIDQVLRSRRPELVQALQTTSVDILGHRHNAYHWIFIHTRVEADHFDAALAGVNAALRYYAGAAPAEDARAWIVAGFHSFAATQARFMARLGEA